MNPFTILRIARAVALGLSVPDHVLDQLDRLGRELDELTVPITRGEVPADELSGVIRLTLAKIERLEKLLAGCDARMSGRDKAMRYCRRWRAALTPQVLLQALKGRIHEGLPAAEVKALYGGYVADLAALEIDADIRAQWLQHGEVALAMRAGV